MATWSKKIGLAVLNLGLMTMTPNFASANDCGDSSYDDPCGSKACEDSCLNGFDLSVDFLYWKTCIDDLTYAASVSVVEPTAAPGVGVASRDIDYHNLCPSWKPGFRITLGKDDLLCGLRFEGSYTWLKSKDSHRSSGSLCGIPTEPVINGSYIESPLIHPIFVNTAIAPGGAPAINNFVYARWEGTYQNWDLLLSYDLCSNRCHSFNPFFGIAGLKFHQQLEVDLAPTCGTDIGLKRMHWENDFFGVGFKAGSLYTYQMCDGLSLFAKGSMTVLTGNSDNKYNRNRQELYAAAGAAAPGVLLAQLDFIDDDCCQFIPGWHLQLGLNYQTEFCGCESNIHFGWEYQLWDNIANPRRFTGNPRPVSVVEPVTDLTALDIVSYAGQSTLTTLGFHGFFVGFDFDF